MGSLAFLLLRASTFLALPSDHTLEIICICILSWKKATCWHCYPLSKWNLRAWATTRWQWKEGRARLFQYKNWTRLFEARGWFVLRDWMMEARVGWCKVSKRKKGKGWRGEPNWGRESRDDISSWQWHCWRWREEIGGEERKRGEREETHYSFGPMKAQWDKL